MLKMDIKELCISLIKDDLTNTRLIMGLEKLGLDASNYSLNLSETIFELMEIGNEEEELFERYLQWCEKEAARDIFKHPKPLEVNAKKIYRKLMKKRK